MRSERVADVIGGATREENIEATMPLLNVDRQEAEFIYAIEIGEIDGDEIEVPEGADPADYTSEAIEARLRNARREQEP